MIRDWENTLFQTLIAEEQNTNKADLLFESVKLVSTPEIRLELPVLLRP